jgi:hypothetical protein
MKMGQVIWAWPHCVRRAALTQMAIDRPLKLIAFVAMNHWQADGGFRLHFSQEQRARRPQNQNCTEVVVENPDFADARAVGRETLGRGARAKRLRRAVVGIPTAKFRAR